jgi:hypothetical protein
VVIQAPAWRKRGRRRRRKGGRRWRRKRGRHEVPRGMQAGVIAELGQGHGALGK